MWFPSAGSETDSLPKTGSGGAQLVITSCAPPRTERNGTVGVRSPLERRGRLPIGRVVEGVGFVGLGVTLDVDVGQDPVEPLGIHQFLSPSSSMVAGTSSMRTMVASSSTAVARPTPISLVTRSGSSRKAPNTNTMISAAAVMTRAVAARPSATEVRLSPVRSHSSFTRERRNTS